MDKVMKLTIDNCHAAFVNLAHRTDRLLHMKKELARVWLIAERFEALRTKDYHWDEKKYGVMLKRTPGAVGCHVSQCGVMEDALAKGKHAFVMEDDLVFCSDFMKRFDIISQFCDSHEWDVIWLGGTFHINPAWWYNGKNKDLPGAKKLGRDAETTDHPNMMRTYGCFSTHAYIVNYNSIERILKLLDENVHLSMGIDWLFIKLQPELYTYSFVPGCVKQYDNQSDIGTGITKYSGFAKLGPYWWQDRMEFFKPEKMDWKECKR